MNTFVKKHFLIALRSNDFPQGKFYLNRNGKYDVIGVLCALHSQLTRKEEFTWKKPEEVDARPLNALEYMGSMFCIPPVVRRWADLSIKQIHTLNEMCDIQGRSFEEIAIYVEEHL